MKTEALMQGVVALLYVATYIYFSWRNRKLIHLERENYKRVFQETLDLFSERYVRSAQRTQVLHVCDWNHARRTHGELMGLPFILPGAVLESAEPIDVLKYFTDDEAEAVIEGLKVFKKDKRTAPLCKHFAVRL